MSRAIAFLFVLFLAACSRPQDEAIARLKLVDKTALRFEAAKLYKHIYASPGPEFATLKADRWPAVFKQLNPMRVGYYPDGFAFTLSRRGSQETGIHVQPQGMDKQPRGAVARYEKLEPGIYWYEIKE